MQTIRMFLLSLNFLDWWLLAAVLALVDVFLLSGWLLSIASAAGITGFILLLFPQLNWPWQLAIFGSAAVAGLGWHWLRQSKLLSGRIAGLQEENRMQNFHDFEISSIDGKTQPFKEFSDKAVLVVNVASKCGLTPQYAGLEKLQREFKDRGFTVLGLPCNQFGAQEPGTETEIKQFCSTNYDVTFPLTRKIDVNGEGAHPLYKWLKAETGGDDIQWNFEKFLIGRDGTIIKRYSPKTVPEDAALRADIEKAVA